MKVTLHDEDEIRDALERVHKEEVHWAMFGYQTKNTLKYLKTGNGLANLVAEFPEKDILYVVVSQVCPMGGNEVTKMLLLTMVGPYASAISKARSSAHRGEFGDIVQKYIPLSSHFQANEVEEICEEEFFAKLRIDPQARAAWKRQAGEHIKDGESGTSKIGFTNYGSIGSVSDRLEKHKKIAEKVAMKQIGLEPTASEPAASEPPVPTEEEEVVEPVVNVVEAEPEPVEDVGDSGGLQFCGECGVPRVGEDLFCGECGSRYES